ncbi:hypothetical protein E5K00_16940 [Hymenobacter aquaticus]|uniref:Uncharacterized protein n=1 Tax=Hymenobacter aquaticus TaxID=1867101 RepID=A0A4Z0PYH1_9BACT|nr:hypothetical protein [Hymenobacter aquaticus]TGE21943.1 hypothetical protein E5K00_16940 [Hymenobacter aquaticus]
MTSASDYKASLPALRQRVPVGIKQALQLLQETDGDVEKAQALFEARCVEIVQAKTGAPADLCAQCLAAVGFDIASAIDQVETQLYSLTERIVRKWQNKEQALDVLASALETAHGLEQQHWFTEEELRPLNEQQFCFMLVREWIEYEEWEGFDFALAFQVPAVSTQIAQKLLLPELAEVLLKASERQLLICSETVTKSPRNLNRLLAKDALLLEYEKYYKRHKSTLFEALYAYVKTHISCFV